MWFQYRSRFRDLITPCRFIFKASIPEWVDPARFAFKFKNHIIMPTPFVSPNCRVGHVLIYKFWPVRVHWFPQLLEPNSPSLRPVLQGLDLHREVPMCTSQKVAPEPKTSDGSSHTKLSKLDLQSTASQQQIQTKLPPLQICKTKMFRWRMPERRLSNEGCHTADPTRKLSNHGFDTGSVSKVCARPCVSRKKLSL